MVVFTGSLEKQDVKSLLSHPDINKIKAEKSGKWYFVVGFMLFTFIPIFVPCGVFKPRRANVILHVGDDGGLLPRN